MARFHTLYLFVTLLLTYHSSAQTRNEPGKQLHIRRANGSIHLDGKLDEAEWKEAVVATDFYLNYPVDTALAAYQTEARLTFDDRSLYISFVCYDNETPDIVQSLRRDFEFESNDNIGVYLGPYNDGINGFYFIVSPMGVQLEGTIAGSGAGGESFNQAWDNKWYSKVVRLKDRWVAEISIPFKSFRYKSEAEEWNITFLRWDLKRNMVSSWIATPIQFIPASFGYSGKLVWTEKPPPHSTNISLIPYVAGGLSQDHETEPVTTGSDLQFGLDAKVGITPSLNLDLTINPDFSQVEVDRQVINLTRFEYQFPERRQFFLENSDLFDLAGFPETRPFFSRRIGIATDTSDNLQRVPILYGARLSGSISKNWRVSMLNMQTKEKLSLGLPAQNYTVATLQRNFWKQSNFALTFVDKESLGVNQGDSAKFFHPDLWKEKIAGFDTLRTLNKYNRVLSADMELLSSDNKWYSSIFYSGSMDSFNESKNQTGGIFGNYRVRNLGLFLGQTFVQKNYNAEVGYVPSKDVYPGQVNYFASANGTLFPKSKTVANMGPDVDFNLTTLPDGTITDKVLEIGWDFSLLNTSDFGIKYNRIYQRLTNTFNPVDEDKYLNYNLGEEYSWGSVEIDYQSDQRKVFKYDLETRYGGFYNGYNWNVNGEMGYRYQPFGSISVRFDYNDLRLPQGYGREKLFVVSPRVDLTFTDKLFLTTFVQYNTLTDNVNLNARFQWRYKPASDFFVVYTENYLPQTFASKSRALVFKFTYWLNI